METIIVCDGCNVGLANDDWTWLDHSLSNQQAEERYNVVHATMETLGHLSHVGDADEPGYFDCYLCDETQCGGGHRWATPPVRRRYGLAELEALPTLCTSQADDLKVEGDGFRIWLSRCGVADGEPYDNKVTVEEYIDGDWTETEHYPAVNHG